MSTYLMCFTDAWSQIIFIKKIFIFIHYFDILIFCFKNTTQKIIEIYVDFAKVSKKMLIVFFLKSLIFVIDITVKTFS